MMDEYGNRSPGRPLPPADSTATMAETKDSPKRKPERERVAEWRLLTLVEAGVPAEIAERVADHFEIDVHEYLDRFVRKGCDPAVAFDLLRGD